MAEDTQKPIDTLRALLASGEFHHATYRDLGTVWEGLWVYRKDGDGFRGYVPATSVGKDDPDLDEAFRLCSGTGISVGKYGGG